MKNSDNSSFQLENYSLEIGKIYASEFPYMWLKDIKGKKPIDLYNNFMPSLQEIMNGLLELLSQKLEDVMTQMNAASYVQDTKNSY